TCFRPRRSYVAAHRQSRVGAFLAKAIDYDEHDHVPRGATFVSVSRPNDEIRATQAFEFLTKHFAVMSTLAVLTASIFAIIYLCAYLAYFDAGLIWLVEYSDVFKVALIVLGFVAGFAFTAHGTAAMVRDTDIAVTEKSKRNWVIGGVTFLVLLHVVSGYIFGHWYLEFYYLFSVLVAIWAVYRIVTTIKFLPDITVRRIFDDFLIVAGTTAVIARSVAATVGEYKSLPHSYSYDVTLKNDKLENVALVMSTAHHTIFYADER